MKKDDVEKTLTVEKSGRINFKHWLSRTVLIGLVALGLILLFEYIFQYGIIVQSLVAIFMTLFLGLFHELIHFIVARNFGYPITWYRTRFMFGFEIEHASIRGKRDSPEKKKIVSDIRKIGRAPYYVIIPLSILLIYFGYIYWFWGVMIAGSVSLGFHIVTFRKEGKSE